MKVAGLNLWAVTLRNGDGESLWVTTRVRSGEIAARKAHRFLKKYRRMNNCPNATIDSISSHGTIDA